MLVAQGSGEIMAEYGTSPWDLAALKPIIEEAGGKLTNWSGESTVFCRDVVATNGVLHEEVRRILNSG
jgi:histidinol-phosphatase